MEIYQCDPDGDIIIQLPSSCPPFAIWDNSAEYPAVKLTPRHIDSKPTAPDFSRWSSAWADADDAAEPQPVPAPVHDELTPIDADNEPIPLDGLVPGEDVLELSDECATSDDYLSAEHDIPSSIGIRVSSRHLILALTYFKRTLKGDWMESHTLQSERYLVTKAPD
jgi:hypothetical protein